jgi:hypothetical protein
MGMNYNQGEYKNFAITAQHDYIDVIPAMYAPHEEYILKVIPLMLEHTWQQKKEKNTSAFDELTYSGWIGRLITLDSRVLNKDLQDEIKGWPVVRDYLIKCLDECKDEFQLLVMIENCMKEILPVLQTRFKENYHFPERMFHCWWYTVHDNNTRLALHLVNAYQPGSPFDHLPHFVSTMQEAVEQAIGIYPDIKIVSCGSWLNQLPKFQQLWPDSFKQNQKIINETGGFGPGAWGQYMTTNGEFHEAKAAILRSTGKHPYALTEAQSNIAEVLAHLKNIISR